MSSLGSDSSRLLRMSTIKGVVPGEQWEFRCSTPAADPLLSVRKQHSATLTDGIVPTRCLLVRRTSLAGNHTTIIVDGPVSSGAEVVVGCKSDCFIPGS